MSSQFIIERNELIERLGVFFEKEEHWAPIAGRILAMITLVGRQGITFDELINTLQVGKSTVSEHLDALQKRGRVSHYHKEGDRRRYFILKRDIMFTFLSKLENEWHERKCIHQSVKLFQLKYIETEVFDKDNFDFVFLDSFLEYMDEVIQSIQKLKNRINK